MTTSDFLTAVRSIADSRPVYREGGTGKDGTCDCIGLVMGALYALGRTGYDLHSSNYFARFQTDHLAPITSVSQLKAGMIVYKARSETAGLNPRYLSGGSHFLLTVRGDSMVDAGILDGDYILVRQQNTARNGQIVAAMVDGFESEATVKTFYKEADHIRLQPENSTMSPIIVKDAKILGKVKGVFRYF